MLSLSTTLHLRPTASLIFLSTSVAEGGGVSDSGDGILAGERTGDIADSEICNKRAQVNYDNNNLSKDDKAYHPIGL